MVNILHYWPYAVALIAVIVAWCASRACIIASAFLDVDSELNPREWQRFPGGCDICSRTDDVIALRNNGRICVRCKEMLEEARRGMGW